MIGFLKKHFGPENCSDEKLLKRAVRAAHVNDITNFIGCCGSWSAMAALPALVGMIFGLPGIVPVALFAGGIAVLAGAIPVIKLTDKIDKAFMDECRHRRVCPDGWDRDYFIPPEPKNDNKPQQPVLADIFDPQAAVTLGDDLRALPSIKLKQRRQFGRRFA